MSVDRIARPEESVASEHLSEEIAKRGTNTKTVALFVVGAQRSGTSALARVLSLCGGALPTGMLGADAANPRGCWEPRKAIGINEEILHRNESAWFDPSMRLQADDAFGAQEKAACIGKIAAYLTTLPDAPFVVIKEPRITTLSELWFEAARLAGHDVAAVIAVRDPQEVISSAMASWGFSWELASALWLKYNLLAERLTRDIPRVFVDYSNLLEDWRRETKRTSAALKIDLGGGEDAAIESFLTPDLRRHRTGGPATERFGMDGIPAVHEALSAAGRDEPLDLSTMDRAFASYSVGEGDVGEAFADFQRRTNSLRFRFGRPAVAKATLGLQAMAHLRKGTWA
ncbi:sulfotransferase family protein [Mycobacterium sp. 2YAF39]|uniref:sulfotransferase family protein n=1 Tax=Mycobacterium sp. 2YAF39 TaxID=3233033 RepID=UPI003F9BBE24